MSITVIYNTAKQLYVRKYEDTHATQNHIE